MFKDDELHETRYCENCLKLQQELQEVMDNYVNLDLSRVKEYNELVDKYKAKEQECEELKKTIMYKCPQCGDEYLSPIGASLYEENNNLKQILTGIKEITEPFCNACQEHEPEKRGNKCIYCNYGKILQKISEVVE